MKRSAKYLFTSALISLLGSNAHAVNVQNFTFTNNPTYTMLDDALLSSGLYKDDGLIITAAYHHLDDPLVSTDELESQRRRVIYQSFDTMSVGAGYRLSDALRLEFNTFAAKITDANNETFNAIGDSTIAMKWRLTGAEEPYSIALVPRIGLPTGDDTYYLSDGSTSYSLNIAIERNFGLFQASANFGYRYANDAIKSNMDYRNALMTSLGIHVPLLPEGLLGVNIEATRMTTMPFNSSQNPNEIYAGVRSQITKEFALFSGAGFGNADSVNSSDYRVVFGVKYTPEKSNQVQKTFDPVVQESRKFGSLVFNKNIFFEHDKDDLSAGEMDTLKAVASAVLNNSASIQKIIIEGHANKLGDKNYNYELAKRRAVKVKEYLISQGLSDNHLEVVSYGFSRPSFLGNISKDRRVEFRIYEKKNNSEQTAKSE